VSIERKEILREKLASYLPNLIRLYEEQRQDELEIKKNGGVRKQWFDVKKDNQVLRLYEGAKEVDQI